MNEIKNFATEIEKLTLNPNDELYIHPPFNPKGIKFSFKDISLLASDPTAKSFFKEVDGRPLIVERNGRILLLHGGIQEWARQYLSQGFSVVPLKSSSKEPVGRWRDYMKERMSLAFVDHLFQSNSGIAIVSGEISGVTVVDIDDMEKFNQFFSFDDLSSQCGFIVKSPRGFHLYFRFCEELKNLNLNEYGFEIKNGKTLVVAPPTVINGVPYSFLKLKEPQTIPESFLKKILSLRKNKSLNKNQALFSVLEKLQILTGYTPQERAPGIWRTKCPAHDDKVPSLDVEMVEGKIQLHCWGGCEEREIIEALKLKEEDLISREFSLPTFAEIYDLDIRVEWVVDKLIPKQAVTVLHGKGGIGKTWLMLQMGSCIAEGKPFLGLATQKMPVCYVDFENSLATLHDRAVILGGSPMKVWHISNENPPPRLDSKDWVKYESLPVGLLIFDTLRASQLLDENSSKDMAEIMSRLKRLREKGFSIILIHHTPKTNEKIYKGSTAIQDQCDHVLSLDRVRGIGEEEVEGEEDDLDYPLRLGVRGKTRYEPFSFYLQFDPSKGFELAPDPDDELLKNIHSFLIGFKDKESIPPNQTQIITYAKDLGINRKKLLRLLRKGEGWLWNSLPQPRSRAILYDPITIIPSSPIYMGWNNGIIPPKNDSINSPNDKINISQPIENKTLSHSSEGIKNNGSTQKEEESLDLSQLEVEIL